MQRWNNDGDVVLWSAPEDYVMKTQILSLSADAAAVDLSADLVGGYLYSVELFASADDAVDFTINSGLGTELFTITTTSATSGEIAQPTGYYPITRVPNYTLANLGSGTITIEVTVIKR